MKLRALCATGLVAVAAVPATASASNSIGNRLQRADRALRAAENASDNGNDAAVVSGLKGATRQTKLALASAARLVKNDRDGADASLSEVTDQQDQNVSTALDLLDGASADVVAAVNATLASTDSGRGQILSLIQGLGDNEVDWGDALTQIADDAVGEIAAATDVYGGDDVSSGGASALDAFVTHETDAVAALVAEVVSIGGNADAALDTDALDTLSSDAADAKDAVGGVSRAGVSGVADKLGTIADAVSQLSDSLTGADDSSGYGDDQGDSYDQGYGDGQAAGDYVTGFADGFFQALPGPWKWAPRGGGYTRWRPSGFAVTFFG